MTSNLSTEEIDRIAKICVDLFYELPKNGKPVEDEWTVLSCVVQFNNSDSSFEVVSLGTGSKCIGATKLSRSGDLLNDSHAEVMARRGFILYLYDNIEKALDNEKSIFTYVKNRFELNENINFYFYSSQLPCGDASILSKSKDNSNGLDDEIGEVLQLNKRKLNQDNCEIDVKKQKVCDDIYRTGAKCLPDNEQDLKCPGLDYHLLGQVRTKPGRGDRTLSVSCSDKISRWIHIGIHGGLLDMLIKEPIRISAFIFGGGVPYSEESLKRALLERNQSTPSVETKLMPEFYQTSLVFPHIKTNANTRSAPGSIVWAKGKNMQHEVAVQGRKLGITKKKASSPKNSLCISKYHLYRRFQRVIMKKDLMKNVLGIDSLVDIPYNEMKSKSERYMLSWSSLKNDFFRTWTVKPDIWNFCVNVNE